MCQIKDGNILQCKICQGIYSKIGRIYDHIRVKHGDDEIAGLDNFEDKSYSDEQKKVSQDWHNGPEKTKKSIRPKKLVKSNR